MIHSNNHTRFRGDLSRSQKLNVEDMGIHDQQLRDHDQRINESPFVEQ